MTMTKISLASLAQAAIAAQETGKTHADLVLEGEQMTSDEMAALQQAAIVKPETAQALEWLKEAKEATFKDPFSRAAYFRGRIAVLATAEKPDAEMVLSTIFSALSSKMFVREGKELVPQQAIPLFRVVKEKFEARKFDRDPIKIPDSNRREKGSPREHIEGSSGKFLIPATTIDRDAYEQLRSLLARMPGVLAEWFEEMDNYDVRHAVWLALHLVSNARVFHPKSVQRIYQANESWLKDQNDRLYLRFDLSSHEVLVLEKNETNERIISRLEIFASAVKRTLKK